ncbi:MAG: cytochrome class protein [Pedosphaera sp.]|nr:cytochrome class protein [Pedosphaera sp.]
MNAGIHMHTRRKFWIGFVCGIIMVLLIAFLILVSGALDLSASGKPGAIEKTLAPWAFERSMAGRFPKKNNPFANDASAWAAGMAHYRENCLICHGAPGIEGNELSMGLNPPAPALDAPEVQELSDGQLFWIVKNGVRWSGMPAFGPTHNNAEIWKIASFLRHLPHLTPEEKEQLRQGMQNNRNHQAARADGRVAEPSVEMNNER